MTKRFERFHLQMWDEYLNDTVDYMTKYSFNLPCWSWLGRFAGGRLNLHHFFQGEPETDAFHDHEAAFLTFPLSSYSEGYINDAGEVTQREVRAFRPHWRPRGIHHVVYGRWHRASGYAYRQYGEGVVNTYRDFWTVVLVEGGHENNSFSVARWHHPNYATYAEWEAVADVNDKAFKAGENEELGDDSNPKSYWRLHHFDKATNTEDAAGVPMFDDVYTVQARIKSGSAGPYGADTFV